MTLVSAILTYVWNCVCDFPNVILYLLGFLQTSFWILSNIIFQQHQRLKCPSCVFVALKLPFHIRWNQGFCQVREARENSGNSPIPRTNHGKVREFRYKVIEVRETFFEIPNFTKVSKFQKFLFLRGYRKEDKCWRRVMEN